MGLARVCWILGSLPLARGSNAMLLDATLCPSFPIVTRLCLHCKRGDCVL